jgi:hypothetical protein
MMTRRPAPGDRRLGHCQDGNGQPGPANGAGRLGDDPLGAQRARLASFWALVLRRFRSYAQGSSEAAANRERHEEGR